MIIGLMQPYFFPYLDYFGLINYSDAWIIFDTVQYINKGWINRNRILHPKEGWQYITVPIRRHKRSTKIKDVQISNHYSWKQRILGQIWHYHKKAPFFDKIYWLVEDCLDENETSIAQLNVSTLKTVCAYIGVRINFLILSEMNLKLRSIKDPDDWALQISDELSATEYVNPIGGANLYNKSKFEAKGIKLTIYPHSAFKYRCSVYGFVQDLSIIDVMMWNSPEEIKAHLDNDLKNLKI